MPHRRPDAAARGPASVVGMAIPPRHLSRARGCAARSFTRMRRSRLRSRACVAAFPRSTTWSRSPAARHPLRAVRDVRHAGARPIHAVARARRTPRLPAREPRDDRDRRIARARRWRSRSRSRHSPRCTGARCSSASPCCSRRPRWTSSSPNSRLTASRERWTTARHRRRAPANDAAPRVLGYTDRSPRRGESACPIRCSIAKNATNRALSSCPRSPTATASSPAPPEPERRSRCR